MMYLRKLPALLALPIMAVAIAIAARIPAQEILSKIIEQGLFKLHAAYVTAMLGAILTSAGRDPLVIGGGGTIGLAAPPGLAGVRPGDGPAVIEADESDGSLIRYRPTISAFVTLDWDHKPLEEVRRLFCRLARQTEQALVLGADSPDIAATDWPGPPPIRTGDAPDNDVPITRLRSHGWNQDLILAGHRLHLAIPGHHNARNAAVAAGAARALGLEWPAIVAGLSGFAWVRRRLERLGQAGGVTVVDDFAHNPEKIAASLATVRPLARRILAVYQPHGFGPTRFLADRLVASLAACLDRHDRIYLAPIYYAGGTARRDISSADLADALTAHGVAAESSAERATLVPRLAAAARPGDLILIMGARDDSLTDFAHAVLEALER